MTKYSTYIAAQRLMCLELLIDLTGSFRFDSANFWLTSVRIYSSLTSLDKVCAFCFCCKVWNCSVHFCWLWQGLFCFASILRSFRQNLLVFFDTVRAWLFFSVCFDLAESWTKPVRFASIPNFCQDQRFVSLSFHYRWIFKWSSLNNDDLNVNHSTL